MELSSTWQNVSQPDNSRAALRRCRIERFLLGHDASSRQIVQRLLRRPLVWGTLPALATLPESLLRRRRKRSSESICAPLRSCWKSLATIAIPLVNLLDCGQWSPVAALPESDFQWPITWTKITACVNDGTKWGGPDDA